MNQKISRRNFIARATGTGLGLLTARSIGKVLGANERVIVGVIGAGGRGRSLMGTFKNQGAEIGGICDVYEYHLNQAQEIAGPQAKSYRDSRELLERKDIDAVIIATPDHWHRNHLIDSLSAGKDVYLEKPMSYSIKQGAEMVKAARASKQIVQIGMQRRSSEAVHAAKKLIDDGMLGQVALVRAQWYWNVSPLPETVELKGRLDWDRFQGPAKNRRPLDAVRFHYWRNFWDYSGGHMTDQGTHLMDVIQWFLNDSKPPRAAQMHGALYQLTGAETPDTFCAIYEYPRFIATWTLTYANSFTNGWSIIFQGNKGTLELDDRGYRFYPEPWPRRGAPVEPTHEFKGGIPTDPHVKNFLECVKSRKEPNAPVEVGHSAVTAPHLANMAFHKKRRAILGRDGITVTF